MDMRLIETLTAADVMTRDVVCLNEELEIRECEKILLERGISGAPVVDREGHLVGVLSKTDIVGHYHETGVTGDIYEVRPTSKGEVVEYDAGRACDLMTPVPCVATESATVADLAALMLRREVHRVVICRRRQVVGIVSSMDILRAIAATRSGQRDQESSAAASIRRQA